MSEPTVEEVREALKVMNGSHRIALMLKGFEGDHRVWWDHDAVKVAMAAARSWMDAAEPDIGEAAKVLGRFFGSGMTHFDLLEIADQTIAAAFGDNNLIRRAE